jgi:pyruvate-formate lyase
MAVWLLSPGNTPPPEGGFTDYENVAILHQKSKREVPAFSRPGNSTYHPMNMHTLSETSMDRAFESLEAARESIEHACRFTETFRQAEHLPPAEREGRMLAIQFPAILQPVEPEDLFAGRIRYAVTGFSPEPVGLGYFCRSEAIEEWLQRNEGSLHLRQKAQRVVAFWQGRTTVDKIRKAFPPETAALLPTDKWTESSGIAFPLYRMAGMVLDYGMLLRLGLERLEKSGTGPDDFGRGWSMALAVLQSSIDHYIRITKNADIRESLCAVRNDPPRTFRQAIQLFWLYALHSGTWNWGRLDDILGPYLVADIEKGLLTDEQALELLCSLWRMMHAYNNMYNNRVIIGGKGRKNVEAADRFALMAIEATRRVRLNQPQLSLRFYEGQNPELWDRAVTAIGEGCTFPMLYNDDVNVPAVASAFNVPGERALDYTPYGCGEYVLSHYSSGTPNGIINLLKALEVAIRGGVDPQTGKRVVDAPPTSELDSFESVWNAYSHVLERHVGAMADVEKLIYDVSGSEAPFLFISMLSSDCLKRRKGAFSGGIRFPGGTLETYGNNNAANSLHTIDELVFRQKKLTLDELIDAMDANFVGNEEVRRLCASISKYGNDEGPSDAMAQRVHNHVCHVTREQASRVGLHSYMVVIINNWANTVLGWHTGASADGRKAGEPLANGNNPAPGTDTSGVTAFLNSLARLDPSIHAGAVQNMKFSKEWFGRMRPKFDALLKTYFARGGTQAMITVVSRDDLEAAIRDPEKWGHLMVRVGGFSIRFIDLDKEAQQEVLHRTLH